MNTKPQIKFKKIKETDQQMISTASVPISKDVYLLGCLVIDTGENRRVVPPYVSYKDKKTGKVRYKTLVEFTGKETKMRWYSRIDGAYLKWRDERNSSEAMSDKVKLFVFKGAFRGREDVFAKYWESSDGRKGYQPACKNEWKKGICRKPCYNCVSRAYLPLTDDIYLLHLKGQDSKGKLSVVGVYLLLEDDTSHSIAADFDGEKAFEEAKEFMEPCWSHKIPAYLERSRSGVGFHVWIFFEDKIPAWKSRAVILQILENLNSFQNKNLEGFDRLFPNQDRLTGRGLGNLIALPLQGQSVQKGCTVFLDPENQFKPYRDQWEFLKSIKRVGEEKFDELIEAWKLKPEERRVPDSHTLGSRESLERVIENCDFIRHCIENPRSLPEGMWYEMISNLVVFEGGAEKIHEFSKPYPRYTWAETEAKILHASRDTAPHNCETIRKSGFNCPKNCDVRSPAGLGYRINNDKNGG